MATSSVMSSCSTVLLAHDDADGYAFTGVALFIGPQCDMQHSSGRLIAELSRAVGHAAEVAPAYL